MPYHTSYRGDVDTESREALLMRDIDVTSHDQEDSLCLVDSNDNDLKQTAGTELSDSHDINATVKETAFAEHLKEVIESQFSESSLDELDIRSHCHVPVADEDLKEGKENSEGDMIAMDELSSDENIILQQRRESTSRSNFKTTHQLHSTCHVFVSILK